MERVTNKNILSRGRPWRSLLAADHLESALVRLGGALLWGAPFLIIALMLLLEAMPVSAGTILLAPPSPIRRSATPGEKFPESRFGASPANPVTGRIAPVPGDEIEEWNTVPLKNTRSPASVAAESSSGFTSATGVAAAANATEDELRSSTAAQNTPSHLPPSLDVKTEGDIRRKGVQEFAVIAGDLGYFPKTIFANVDVPIRLYVTGASKSTLCVIMDAFQVRRQVTGQKVEEITFTPSTPGRFRFYCPVNGMEGTLVVKEPSLQLAGESARTPASE